MTGVGPALALVGREWKLVLIALFAAGFLVTLSQRNEARQALKTEKAERKADDERADRERAERENNFATTIAAALDRRDQRDAAREPIIVRSTNTVREYAQTDAGRARCLDADGVRSFAEDRRALFADPGATSSGPGTLPSK